MNLSVIIPVYNGAQTLPRCLAALRASTRVPDEIIVVDDSSTDDSAALARTAGARVITLTGGPRGAAFARNRGAKVARGDVLVFIDADVVLHADALARIEQVLADNADVAAVFGSYDDNPPARNLVSLYKNLLHHFVHQQARRDATTFWAGCGAIRREIFNAVGRFDESYTRPSIEDIELGARLWRAGRRVWLCPEIQCTHLKRWTWRALLKSDICDRAVPWTQLILREQNLPNTLNLDTKNRASALLAWIIVTSALVGFWLTWLWMVLLVALGALIALNVELYRLFARRGGIAFAVGAIGLHFLYFLYSSAVFGALVGTERARALWQRATTPRGMLVLLLVVTLCKGWLWSIIVPMWQANDEDQHFGYAQEIVRQGTLNVAMPEQVPLERALLWEMLSPLRYSAQREPFDLSAEGIAQLQNFNAQLDSPEARATLVPPIWFAHFVKQHPPLYYALQAIIHQIGAAQNILTRMEWMRLFSVLLGVATVICAYGAARALWNDARFALLIATLVSFHPLFTFFTSVVNNAALEFLCFGALTWTLVLIARRGMTIRRGAMLGALLAAGLLTRSSFVAAIPLVAIIALRDLWRARSKTHWRAWSIVAILPIVLASWWYRDFLFTGGGAFVQVYKDDPGAARAVSLVNRIASQNWYAFLHEWWGVFGWRDTWLPTTMYRVLDAATLLTVVGVGAFVIRALQRKTTSGDQFAILLGVGATLMVIAFYIALDYRMAQAGGGYKIQGRYFLAPLVPQAMLLAVGWAHILRRRWLGVLALAMIALNVFALAGVIVPRYYGEQIVAQFAPSDAHAQLTPRAQVSRAITIASEWTRADVWLTRRASGAIFSARDGRAVTRWIEPMRMAHPYPTTLRFETMPAGNYNFTVQGEDGQIALAADNQIALKIFRRVSPRELLARLVMVQSIFHNAWALWILVVANGVGIIWLVTVLMQTAIDNH